jgi:ABC-type multidrug transport system fused ATPase/permease subunit
VFRDGFALVWQFIRAHPLSFAVAALGAALFASAIVASSVVVGSVTDSLIIPVLEDGESASGLVWPAVAAVVGVAVWKAFGITLRRIGAGYLQYRTQADLRKRMVHHLFRLDLGWHSRQATGDLLAVSDTDARMATFILAPLPYATGASLLLVGTVVLIAAMDWVLGLITLVSIVTVVAIDIRGSWKMFLQFQGVQRDRGIVSGIAHESFDGALTVKSLGREQYETDRLQEASETLRDGFIVLGRTWATYRSVVEAIPAMTTVVLIVVGAFRIGTSVSAGDLVTVAYLLSLLTLPIQLIGFVLWEMGASQAAWGRVSGVLDAGDYVEHGERSAAVGGDGAPVEGSAVQFRYDPATPVLEDLDLDIPAGKTIALVGPTGSGKSTLALLLARLWDPTSGSIHLDGRDLREFAPSELPLEVAFVSQDAFLFEDTVSGNITLGAPVPPFEVEAAAALAGATEFIEALPEGYGTLLGERGMSLSGGQRQRIALARAVARRPRLLILDDATSAVDPSVEASILRGLSREELPSTVLVVAYRKSAITLADEVMYIEDGRILDYGTHPEVMSRTVGYARLLQAYEQDALARAQHRSDPIRGNQDRGGP